MSRTTSAGGRRLWPPHRSLAGVYPMAQCLDASRTPDHNSSQPTAPGAPELRFREGFGHGVGCATRVWAVGRTAAWSIQQPVHIRVPYCLSLSLSCRILVLQGILSSLGDQDLRVSVRHGY